MSEDGTIAELGHYETTEVGHEKKYETVVSSGQSALKALLTMNGGATIAFLSFIAHLLDNKTFSPASVPLFVPALQLFIYGTFITVFAYGTIFLTNCLSSRSWHRSSNWMFGATLLCGFASIGFFLAASWRAVDAFQTFSKALKP
ncbi:MAG: hypothetical protein JO093_09555 [Acidobacteria bacterium]|nr:hypothetical protein [Acidobacteriota bacterium]MBV9070625.1 hypothetical protein [Acidobacteriota bacterium]MBV9185860.1 hypothetical protein [Acidobacteriota bacterium]